MASKYDEERDIPAVAKKDYKDYCRGLPLPDWSLETTMKSYLLGRFINHKVASYNYWYPSSVAGDTVARIVIPATSAHRHNKFWQARYMGYSEHEKRYQSPGNCRRGDAVVITYPIPAHAKKFSHVFITEGAFDALAASECGVTAIALLGVTPSDEVLWHVKSRTDGRSVVLVADKDAESEMVDVMVRLYKLGFREEIKVVSCAPWKDFADMPNLARMELMNQWLC